MYSRCLCHLPEHCDHYHFMGCFDQPWHAKAHHVLFVRFGILAASKEDHFKLDRPTSADYESVRDELPEVVFHKDILRMEPP